MIPFVNRIDWLFLTFSPLSPSHFSRLSPLRRKCLVCVSVMGGRGGTQTQMHICSITDLRLLPRRLSRPTHAVDLFVAFSYPCRNLCPIINSLSFLNLSQRVRYKKHHLSLLYKWLSLCLQPWEIGAPFSPLHLTKGEFPNHTECSQSQYKRTGLHLVSSIKLVSR